MRLLLPGPAALGVDLLPWFRGQDIVDVLDAVVAPDGVVDAGPTQGLEGVVDVGQGHPAVLEELRQEGLVGKVHAGGAILHEGDDAVVVGGGRVDDLQAAVHVAQGPDGGVDALGLGLIGRVVLVGEGAVGGDPVGRVVGSLEGVADAGVAGGEDALPRVVVVVSAARRVELELHQLVHVLEDEHVRVELDDAGVLGQREGRELGPAVVEARVVGVVLGHLGEQVRHMLPGDAAGGERGVAFRREGVGGEGDERVLGADEPEGVLKSEEARQVVEVRDEGCPDCRRG